MRIRQMTYLAYVSGLLGRTDQHQATHGEESGREVRRSVRLFGRGRRPIERPEERRGARVRAEKHHAHPHTGDRAGHRPPGDRPGREGADRSRPPSDSVPEPEDPPLHGRRHAFVKGRRHDRQGGKCVQSYAV